MALPRTPDVIEAEALRSGLTTQAASYWSQAWRRFRRNKLAMVGASILLILIVASIIAPYISPYGRDEIILAERKQGPSDLHLLGTDELGRDLFTRLLYGGRVSFTVAFTTLGIYMAMGILIGGIAGYFGGTLDNILMRLADIVISFPFILLVLTLVAILGPSTQNLIIVLALASWPGPARLVRGEFLSIRERDYVEAAHAMGAPSPRIILRHMLPNAMAPLIVSATLDVAYLILTEASLSYLGFGVRDPVPSWGNMLTAADITVLRTQPWVWIPPGVCIFLAVISINFVGDGLRDALDPRLKH